MLEWLFRNRETGEITIAQFPNPPLWILVAAVVARWFVPEDSGWHTAFGAIALAALVWWAGDEIVRGVNPWRRILGASVLVIALALLVVR